MVVVISSLSALILGTIIGLLLAQKQSVKDWLAQFGVGDFEPMREQNEQIDLEPILDAIRSLNTEKVDTIPIMEGLKTIDKSVIKVQGMINKLPDTFFDKMDKDKLIKFINE